MCRLCAITATQFGAATVPTSFKAQLVHECMMRSAHDELGQKDGWGVTDGHKICASTNWYMDSIPHWLPSIKQDGVIISHLRKASGGTGRTIQENHPYRFIVNGTPLIAAHNGFFAGTNWKHWETGNPATDSWRALNDLALLMAEQNTDEIDGPLIEEWLGNYEVGSHYAVLLYWRNRLYAVRGSTRTLAALVVGNGYLIHTNIGVLHTMKRYINELYGVETGDPVIISDNRLVRFELGSRDVIVTEIKPKLRNVQTYATTWRETNYPKANAAIVLSGETKSAEPAHTDGEYTVAASVLPRRARTIAAEDDFTLKERRQAWSVLAGKLSPLRRDLGLMWVSQLLGYTGADERPLGQQFLTRASRKEFELVESILLPKDTAGKYVKPFSPMANLMLNWWSHLVKPGYDAELHWELFGTKFFWLDGYYTKMAATTSATEYDAMHVWQRYMLAMLSNLSSHQANAWLDMSIFKKVAADILDSNAAPLVWYDR